MSNVTILAQLLAHLPSDKIRKIVAEEGTDKASKGIDTWTHLVSMLFCHLSNSASVRDISNGMRSITGNLNHLGCKSAPSKSCVSYINKNRSHHVFEKFFHATFQHLKQHILFGRDNFTRLKRQVYLLDATVIPLCIKLFDWAKFRAHKGAVKIHMLLDYDGCLPSYAVITEGKVHESKIAKAMSFPKGSVVVFDRGYLDFKWLKDLASKGIFFVTRAKDNMVYEVSTAYEVDEDQGFIEDDNILLTGSKSRSDYTKTLRRVSYIDPTTEKELVFLTNNKYWTAETVADLYKERWHIESFFKHIKNHLRIKSFVGTTENAVNIQIWTALITILLLKAMQHIAKYKWHLSNLVAFLRLNLFVKISLYEYLHKPFINEKLATENIQPSLFT